LLFVRSGLKPDAIGDYRFATKQQPDEPPAGRTRLSQGSKSSNARAT
jgi:hypothetical protein